MVNLTNARFGGVGQHPDGPEVSEDAGLAVDAVREVLALLAHAAALHVAVDVEGEALLVDLFVVVTFVRVAIAVARFTLIRVFSVKIQRLFVNQFSSRKNQLQCYKISILLVEKQILIRTRVKII